MKKLRHCHPMYNMKMPTNDADRITVF